MSTQPGSRISRASLIAAALAAALGAAACDSGERMAGQVKEQAGAMAQKVDDATITAKVKAALAAEPKLATADISVATEQGRVTLSGRVPDPAQSEEAAAKARGVEGVQEVENRLEVGTAQG